MMRQQRWSLEARTRVIKIKGKDGEASYNTLARKMPSLLQRAGLLQALVFLKSRAGSGGDTFLTDLAQVYGQNADELLQSAQTKELASYLALSRDIMDVAIWFRRFAQIELQKTEDGRA
jgi:CRISPR-associated protein Cmr5